MLMVNLCFQVNVNYFIEILEFQFVKYQDVLLVPLYSSLIGEMFAKENTLRNPASQAFHILSIA